MITPEERHVQGSDQSAPASFAFPDKLRREELRLLFLTPQSIMEDLGDESSATFTRVHNIVKALSPFPDIKVEGILSLPHAIRSLLRRPVVVAPYPSCLNSPTRHLLFKLSRLLGCRIILEIQDSRDQARALLGRESHISSRLERKTLQAGSAFILPNPTMWNALSREYRLEGPVLYLGPGVEDSYLEAYPEPYRAVPGRFNIVYLGTVSRNKGIEVLIEAVRLVNQEHREATLHLIGPITEEFLREKRSLLDQAFIKSYSVAHKEVPSALKQMDVQVILYDPQDPYLSIISPTKLFEYLGTTRPIIASRSPPITSLDLQGLIYVDSNPESVRRQLLRLMDPKLREGLSRTLMEQREEQTWSRRGRALHSFLRSIGRGDGKPSDH